MHVKMLKAKSVPVDSLTILNFPDGWSGEVKDEIVASWKVDDDYEAVIPEGVKQAHRQEFLNAFADTAMEAASAGGLQVEPDDDDADAEPENADDLRAMTVPQLKVRARAANIRGYSKMNEGELIAALLGG
jgi:hypothetical protein